MAEMPRYSVVIPAHNEADAIGALLVDVCAVMHRLEEPFEILVVDDGSMDATWDRVSAAARDLPEVAGYRLNRNFGQEAALYAGLELAQGQAIAVMDADGQDPPEVLADLFARWTEGYDVAYAVRKHRKEGFVKRGCYRAFYRVFSALAAMPIPLDSGDFSVIDRRVAQFIQATNDRAPFFRGLRSWYGGKQIGVAYDRSARAAGKTHYNWFHLTNTALTAITSFSRIPLRLAVYAGSAISLLSFAYVAFIVLRRLIIAAPAPEGSRGWSSLVTLVGLLGGLNLLTLGLVGEYIAHVFECSKKFPIYLVRESTRDGRPPETQLSRTP